MRIAVIPLTANPFHEGHWDIGRKTAKGFDKVIYAMGYNPEKSDVTEEIMKERANQAENEFKAINEAANKPYKTDVDRFEFMWFTGFLTHFVHRVKADAVVRGIRGIDDLGHEMKQQFWSEDLGMEIPVFLVLADRGLQHISSSGIRQVRKVNELNGTDHRPKYRLPIFGGKDAN